jgi:hypothetical protein
MESYLAVVLVILLTLVPLLIPVAVTVVHATRSVLKSSLGS